MFGFSVGMPPWVGASRLQKKNKNPAASPKATPYGGGSSPTAAVTQQSQLVESLIAVNLDTPQQQQVNGRSNSRDNFKNTQPRQRRRVIISTTGQRLPNQKDPLRERLKSLPTFRECCRQVDPLREQKLQKQASNPDGKQSGGASGPRALPGEKLLEDLEKQDKPTSDFLLPEQEDEDPSLATFDAEKQSEWTPPVKPKIDPHASTASGGESSPFSVGTWKRVGQKLWFANLASSPSSGEKKDGDTPPGEGEVANPMDFMSDFRDNLPHEGDLFRMIEDDKYKQARDRVDRGATMTKKERLKRKEEMDGPPISERQQEFLAESITRDKEMQRRARILRGKAKHAKQSFQVVRAAMKLTKLAGKKWGQNKRNPWVIDPDIFGPSKDERENETEITFFEDMEREEDLRLQRQREDEQERAREAAMLEEQERLEQEHSDMQSVADSSAAAKKKAKKRKTLSAKKAKTAKENELLERKDYLLRWLEKHHGNLREAKEESIQKRQIFLNYHWLARLAINFYALQSLQMFIMLVITFNVIILSLDMWPMPDRGTSILLDDMNYVCTIIFLVEFVAAHLGLGFIAYWTTPSLIFDGFIVLASVAELVTAASGGGSQLTSLRGLRLLRVFRLARKWKSLALLMWSMYRSFIQLGNFTLLLCLMIAVFALMGQTFFAATLVFDPDTGYWLEECSGVGNWSDPECVEVCPEINDCRERLNFDTFLWAVTTILVMLTGEDWPSIMFAGMKTSGLATIYFLLVVGVGSFLILNLFVAILMSSFEEQSEKNRTLVEALKMQKIEQEGVRIAKAQRKQAMAGSPSEHLKLIWNALNKREMLAISNEIASRENSKEIEDTTPQDSPQDGTTNPNSVLAKKKQQKAAPIMIRDDLNILQASFMWVSLATKRTSGAIDKRVQKLLRRVRRRFMIFKRISLGSKSFFIFPFKGIDEIMMQIEKVREADSSELKNIMKEQMMISQHEMDEMEKLPWYKKYYKKYLAWIPEMFKRAEKIEYEDDELSLGSTASSEHRSPFTKTDVSFRERMRRVMKHPKFDQVILLCIATSSLLMIVNTPLSDPRAEPENTFYFVMDWFFGIIFTAEMFTKMIAMGVLVNNNPAPEQFAELQEDLERQKLEEEERQIKAEEDRIKEEKERQKEQEKFESERAKMDKSKVASDATLAAARGQAITPIDTSGSSPRTNSRESSGSAGRKPGGYEAAIREKQAINIAVGNPNVHGSDKLGLGKVPIPHSVISDSDLQISGGSGSGRSPAAPASGSDTVVAGLKPKTVEAVVPSKNGKVVAPNAGKKKKGGGVEVDDMEAQMENAGKGDATAGEEEPPASAGSTTSSLAAILYDTEYQQPYMSDPWNMLDFIVVCVAWIELTQVLEGGSFLKVLRLFRTLRPLRMISRNPNLKLVVTTLFKSFPQLVTLCVFGGFILLLFGVFATSYLKGALSECKGEDGADPMEFYNSTCRDEFCNDQRLGFCVDTYNYDFVTYATYAEIEADDPYLHLKYSLFPNSTASAAAAPSELSLVDFRSDANYWSSNRMCYEQLRYSFFEPKSELTSTVTSTVPQNNQPAITTLQTADLLYQPDDPTSKAYQPTTYNESYWQLTYPDPAIRETRIREEIQRRYRPQLRGSKDTPLCVVNCAEVGNSHPFCVASEVKQDEQTGVWSFDQNIWGHRVIPCTSCYTNFCENTGVETESEEHCKYQCDGPSQYNLYCTDGACDDPNSAQCLTCKNECIAQCKCPQVCLPHLKDATSCILAKGRWWRVVPGMGFDNILKAAFTLFQVITTEGWVVIMLAVVDQDGIYADPIRDNIELWVIFFWIYSLVGYFFLANVVIGVIIDNFNQMKRDAEADTSEQKVLSEAQQRWVQCQKVFYATRSFFLITNVESLPAGQRGLFFFVASKKFESFIMSCIVLNIFAMAFRVHPEPTNKNTLAYDLHIVIEPINLFCLIVFNVEFILKLIAYRTGYFSDMWNKFDFSCVVSSNIGYILELLNVGDTGSLSIIRMFRIIRLFRLVRFLSGLNQLSGAFLLSIPKLGNVSAILGLVLLIFALLGMNLFSPFLMLDSFAAYGPSANFLTFWDSMLTLLRCMTGEAWNSIMADLATEQFETQSVLNQPCVQEMAITKDNFSFLNAEGYLEKPIQCGNTETAYVFFVMFIVFVFFIVLNLFIAVIFEGFEESRQLQVGNILQLAMDLWSEYDPKYELILPVDHAITFVGEVLEKSGLDTDEDSNLTLAERRVKMMRSYALQVTPAGDTHFLWCCQAILRKTIVQNSPELARQLEELDTDTSGSLMTKQVIEMREQRIAQTESTATEFVAKKKVFGLERYDARLSIDIIIRGIRKARVRLRKRKHDQWQAALLRLFTNMDGHVKKCGLLATRTMYSKTANRLRYIILQDAKVFQGIPTATVMDAVLMSYGIDRYKSLEDKTANPKLNPSALRKCQSFVGGNISLFYFYNWLDKRVDPPPDPGLRRITGPPLEGRVNARRGDSDERKVLETLDFEDPDLLLSAEQYLNRYDRFGRRRRASHDGRKSRAGGPKHDVIEVDTSERLDAGLRRGGAHSDEASSSDFYQDDKYRRRPGSDLEEEEKNRTKAAKDYLSQQKEDPASPIIPKSLIPDPVIQTTAHADVNIQDLTQPKPKAEKDKIRKERKDRQERNKRKLQFVIDNQAIHEEERRKMMLDFVEKNSLKLQREQSGEAASGSSVSLKTENAQKWVDNWREKEQERLMIEKEKLYALERQIASETAVKSPSLSQRVLEESGIGSPTSRGNLNAEQHEDGTIERASKTTELNSESTVGGGNGTMLGSSGTA
ncbi:unnamed protein product [Amoebophrya sp. A120]|nr:unnamed protein product [Amoebophrya sp. A120]|eukprot:GSA120T00014164001.1